MASPPRKYSSRIELSERSSQTGDDTSAADYPLTRQPGPTSPEATLLPLTDAQEPISTVKVTPRTRSRHETRASTKKITTTEISLADVTMVQLFLRATDGSVKGITFDYMDSDVVDFGCCVAEPGCWHMWEQPQWLLFTPAKGRSVSRSRGFVPLEEIGFADMNDYPNTEGNAMGMRGSLALRLSKKGLELDVGIQERFCRRVLQRAKGYLEAGLGRNLFSRGNLQQYERLEAGEGSAVGLRREREKKPSYFFRIDHFGIAF